MYFLKDTICAPSTVLGTGAISIIRVSGPEALGIADKVIRFRKGDASSASGHSLKMGDVFKDGELLDEVVVGIYRGLRSYTGEDMVEIFCHASLYIGNTLMQLLLDAGARLAAPGEFTRRAFAAGKMDLSQAEAVADLIASQSEASHRVAVKQMKGGYSAHLRSLRDKLIDLASLMELELDFSEEDVEFADRTQLSSLLGEAISEVYSLKDSFRLGNAIRSGVPVAIVGDVNSGKSTLLNAILGEERAIVSDIPGTTRDTVEDTRVIDGVTFRFIDTAGLRDTSETIEKIGIERSFEAVSKADLIICVLDASSSPEAMENAVAKVLPLIDASAQTLVFVRNKTDLLPGAREVWDKLAFEKAVSVHGSSSCVAACTSFTEGSDAVSWSVKSSTTEGSGVPLTGASSSACGDDVPRTGASVISGNTALLDISARTGAGVDELKAALSLLYKEKIASADTMVTNLRHYEALSEAGQALERVRGGLALHLPTDLVAQDLREAIANLGTIFGEVVTDDILGRIFEKFCIGK